MPPSRTRNIYKASVTEKNEDGRFFVRLLGIFSPLLSICPFLHRLVKAYDARAMERRKSKQFDGTDAVEPPDGAPASPAVRINGGGGMPKGLLRREVSRAYTAVASAGDAVADSSVEALGVLLRLMDEQVHIDTPIQMISTP